MARWGDFAAAEPGFADLVERRFAAHRHHTMATLRRDGAPRISGTEVQFEGGDLLLGMMPGALRVLDLRRDPRVAIHSHSVDPPEGDPATWPGEAVITGVASEVPPADPADRSHRFRVDLTQVVLTRIGSPADHLVIESWRPGDGITRSERR